ncbi:Hypothetical predicted protein [Mytilus galloprovincialis]|uniref:Uncharacterized protein n=1 Tax=Mytilus galloprovincialis TaxID=29158 RepID=A0A8B6CW54_MYTGA|nr:Hypothetical predicted protein [Mytilus galloprovincialis]
MAVNKMFISALKRNDIDRAISLMICPGYDVNSVAYKDCTPLILSTKLGLVKVVQHLLSLGADTNWQDKNGRSALTHACISGNTEIIRELFKAGCNLNRPTVFGDRPIHEAVVYGRLEAVEVLLKAGVDINSKNSITKQTALQLAVLSEQKEVVDLLIQKNVAIDIPTFEGETALHYAVQVNDFRIVKSLIAAGASIHKKNQIGETPYLLAVQEGKIDHVKTLILAGCKMYFLPICHHLVWHVQTITPLWLNIFYQRDTMPVKINHLGNIYTSKWRKDIQNCWTMYITVVYDVLQTPRNLTIWKLFKDPSCKLCVNPANLELLLSSSRTALKDGRYTWHHDQVLRQIAVVLDSQWRKKTKIEKGPKFMNFIKGGGESSKKPYSKARGILATSNGWEMQADVWGKPHSLESNGESRACYGQIYNKTSPGRARAWEDERTIGGTTETTGTETRTTRQEMDISRVCSCWKIFKQDKGLKIHCTKMAVQ